MAAIADASGQTKGLIESIYGTAMAMTAEAAQSPRGAVLCTAALTYAYLLVNFVFQGYLLYAIRIYICVPAALEVRSIYDDFRAATHVDGALSQELWHHWDDHEKVRLCQVPLSQPVLFVALLLVWTSHVQADVRETLDYAISWANLPRPEDIDCKGQAKLRDDDGLLVVEAASREVKAFVFGLILLPKFAIAVVLWWLGASWLTATTSFGDLVLNAVALAFITDVDEIFYRSLVAQELKNVTTRPRCLKSLVTMVLLTLSLTTVPAVYLRYHQDVIPEYQWVKRSASLSYCHYR